MARIANAAIELRGGEAEITSEMVEAGKAILYDVPGFAPCGVDFDPADLVVKVYLAMLSHSTTRR